MRYPTRYPTRNGECCRWQWKSKTSWRAGQHVSFWRWEWRGLSKKIPFRNQQLPPTTILKKQHARWRHGKFHVVARVPKQQHAIDMYCHVCNEPSKVKELGGWAWRGRRLQCTRVTALPLEWCMACDMWNMDSKEKMDSKWWMMQYQCFRSRSSVLIVGLLEKKDESVCQI